MGGLPAAFAPRPSGDGDTRHWGALSLSGAFER
jgi:hypothetical protein